jgi:hypothetical protein
MRNVLENKQLFEERGGVEEPPRIRFQDLDAFDCWVWVELYKAPTARCGARRGRPGGGRQRLNAGKAAPRLAAGWMSAGMATAAGQQEARKEAAGSARPGQARPLPSSRRDGWAVTLPPQGARAAGELPQVVVHSGQAGRLQQPEPAGGPAGRAWPRAAPALHPRPLCLGRHPFPAWCQAGSVQPNVSPQARPPPPPCRCRTAPART